MHVPPQSDHPTIIQLYIYVLIAAAVLSWLIAFNVVNTRNQFVAMLADALWRLTEPVLRADPAHPAQSRRTRPVAGGAHPPAHLHRATCWSSYLPYRG